MTLGKMPGNDREGNQVSLMYWMSTLYILLGFGDDIIEAGEEKNCLIT